MSDSLLSTVRDDRQAEKAKMGLSADSKGLKSRNQAKKLEKMRVVEMKKARKNEGRDHVSERYSLKYHLTR